MRDDIFDFTRRIAELEARLDGIARLAVDGHDCAEGARKLPHGPKMGGRLSWISDHYRFGPCGSFGEIAALARKKEQ